MPAPNHPLHCGRQRRLPLRIGERHEEYIKVEHPAGLLGTPPVQAHLRSSFGSGPSLRSWPARATGGAANGLVAEGRRSHPRPASSQTAGSLSDHPSVPARRSAPGPAFCTARRLRSAAWRISRACCARSFFAPRPPFGQKPFRPCRSSLSPPRALDWRSPVERLRQGEVCLERLQSSFPPGVPCVQAAGLAHLRLPFALCRFVQGLRLPPGLNRAQGGLLRERQGNRLILNKKKPIREGSQKQTTHFARSGLSNGR